MKKLITILILATSSLYAVDDKITNLTTLSTPATGDWLVAVDISDTTQSASGTNKKLAPLVLGTLLINDTAYAAGWDTDTDEAPSKNAVYDWAHTFDTDDDGKVNLLDGISAAGFVYTNSSGLIGGTRTIAEGLAIDITNGDGASGNPTAAFDPTELTGSRTFGDASTDTIVWTWDRNSGTDPTMTVASAALNFSGLQVAGVAVSTASTTDTWTNKTYDASATGNVVKFKSFPQFTSPLRVDGTNATIGSTSTAVGYGLATFSNSADEASNWAEWRILVPADWDTSVDPRVKLADLIGADTGARQYTISVASVASSASGTAPTLGTAIDVNMAADASGVANDIQISSTTTLTGWGAALTPGQLMVIRVARDGDQTTQDASNVNSTLVCFELEYGATQ